MSFDHELFELPTWQEIRKANEREIRSPRRVGVTASTKVLALILLAMTLAATFSLIKVPWVQTISATGRVVSYSPDGRQQSLQSPVDGRIALWHAKEGDRVKQGDLVVEIADMDPNIMERLSRANEALQTKLSAAQKSLATSKINLDRQRALWEQGLSARRAYELAELEYAKFLSELSSASAELAQNETRLARQASQAVTAPQSGIVQRIVAPQGGVMVKQGDPLAIIVPESADRAVELFVSGNDIPLLSVGRPVRLQFEGWPAVQFSGWPSVAVGTFGGEVGVIDPSDDGQGRFRIVVFQSTGESWPDVHYLRQGVRVQGWVLLEEVKLGWELWRRFNAFPLSLPKNSNPETVSKK